MSELSEMPHKKHRSHFSRVLSETWKETELRDVIIMDLVGTAMTLFLAVIFHVVGWDEIKELVFLAIVGGGCGVIASFTYRFFFVTPAKLFYSLEEQLETVESKLNELQTTKPLEIGALPPKSIAAYPHSIYACEIFVRNDNQAVGGVKLKLLQIEPSFLTRDARNATYALDSINFLLNDSPVSTLNPGEKSTARIFIVERPGSEITLQFASKWEWPNVSENLFAPRYRNQSPEEYILTFETSAVGIAACPTRFKMMFCLDQHKPPFTLEKINPPQPVISLENGSYKPKDQTKRHKDPASVILLICLSASLGVVAVTQRFQIVKLTNPPPPKIIAHKPIPDKIIPQPAILNLPAIILPAQASNVESPIQFETSNPSIDSGDSKSELARIKAKKISEMAAQKEAAKKQTQSDADSRWKAILPIYNGCIENFYNILKNEADRRHEGISKTVTYFNCLPSTINYELGETNIAEIRFQNQTNVDFRITISGCDQFSQRALRVSASCGYFVIRHDTIPPLQQCNISIHVQDLNDEQNVPLDQPDHMHNLIEEDLRLLKDGQIAYLSQTNHSQ